MTTDTQQLPATQAAPDTIQAAPVTEQQAAAWVGMAHAKNNLVAELTRAELSAQGLLQVPANDHAAIDAALANYRKSHADMVETRKAFTSQVQAGIIDPLMTFEKRVDPKANDQYRTLEATSLQLRKQAADDAARVNAINQEIGQFKAHCTNEFSRIASSYQAELRREIDRQYSYWLGQRITPDIDRIKQHLSKIPIEQVTKFQPRYITPDQMAATYNEVRRTDFQQMFNDMMHMVDLTFANFDSDIANAEAAIQQREEARKLQEAEEAKKLTEEQAITTLIVSAETVQIDAPKIKRTVQVTIIESEAWAKAVMAAFIVNLPHLAKYIRVKSWAKLTIGQMAEYLGKLATETGDLANGLSYEEVEK